MLQSFKYEIEILKGSWIFPPTWFNYEDVFYSRRSDFPSNIVNSLIVASASTMLVLIVGTLAAYSLSRLGWSRWIEKAFLGWTLIFNMIPPITLVGPWYLIFREHRSLRKSDRTHLDAHHTAPADDDLDDDGLVNEVPREIEEAATVDGCGASTRFA